MKEEDVESMARVSPGRLLSVSLFLPLSIRSAALFIPSTLCCLLLAALSTLFCQLACLSTVASASILLPSVHCPMLY